MSRQEGAWQRGRLGGMLYLRDINKKKMKKRAEVFFFLILYRNCLVTRRDAKIRLIKNFVAFTLKRIMCLDYWLIFFKHKIIIFLIN